MWRDAAVLPMTECVGLVTGDLVELGGEGEADLPAKKNRTLWLSIEGESFKGATIYG